MALTGTAKGVGSRNTSGANVQVSPSTGFNNGSIAVVIFAYDNSGSGGTDPFTSMTDTKGNTWTLRLSTTQSPGNVANDGLCFRVYTASQSAATNLGTSDNVSASFSPAVTAAVAMLWQVDGTGSPLTFSGATAQGNGFSPSVTTPSIPVNSLVLGIAACETTALVSDDSDTTNGSWSTSQTRASTAGMIVNSQYKVVTGAGAQTYNIGLGGSTDWVVGWLRFEEPNPIAVIPPKLSLTTTRFSPTIKLGKLVTPGNGALATTPFAPSIVKPTSVIPATKTLAVTPYAPSALRPTTVVPSTSTLTTAGFAPTVVKPLAVVPSTRSVVTTKYAPSVVTPKAIIPSTKSVVTSGFAPSVVKPRTVTPGNASLATSGFSPTVVKPRAVIPSTSALAITRLSATARLDNFLTPATAAAVLTAFAPTVYKEAFAKPGPASLTITTFSPTNVTPKTLVPGKASLAVSGFAPEVVVQAGAVITPNTRNLTVAGYAPFVVRPTRLTPGTYSLATTLYAPTAAKPQTVIVGAGSLSLAGLQPSVVRPMAIRPDVVTLVVTRFAPSVVSPLTLVPETIGLELTGQPPSVFLAGTLSPGKADLFLTLYAPRMVVPQSLIPGTSHLTLVGYAPFVDTAVVIPGPSFRRYGDVARSFLKVAPARVFRRVEDTARTFNRINLGVRVFRGFYPENPMGIAYDVWPKDESEKVSYIFNFEKFPEWDDGSTISDFEVTSTEVGLTISGEAISSEDRDGVPAGKGIVAFISGGTSGNTYDLECLVTFSDGSERVVKGRLVVE